VKGEGRRVDRLGVLGRGVGPARRQCRRRWTTWRCRSGSRWWRSTLPKHVRPLGLRVKSYGLRV